MRLSLPTLLFCAILLATTAWSQQGDLQKHPDDPNATRIGTLQLHIAPQSDVQHRRSTLGDAQNAIIGAVVVFRSEGRTDYFVNADSISFLGDCAWVDGTSTVLLFDMICRTAILQGLAEGHSPCVTDCSQATSTISRVYVASCVRRFGTGAATKFNPCSPYDYCMREYVTCCPNGIEAPVVQMIRSVGVPCSQTTIHPYCESTCP